VEVVNGDLLERMIELLPYTEGNLKWSAWCRGEWSSATDCGSFGSNAAQCAALIARYADWL